MAVHDYRLQPRLWCDPTDICSFLNCSLLDYYCVDHDPPRVSFEGVGYLSGICYFTLGRGVGSFSK